MPYLLVVLTIILICLSAGISAADSTDVGFPTPFLHDFLEVQTTSLQFSLFSYKPELGDLADLLRNLGAPEVPSASMPSIAVVLQHTSALDSRLEVAYWDTELEVPPPTSTTLSASLMPISYQLIYRPGLLSDYVPLYFGGGIGFLRANFSRNLEQVGLTIPEGVFGWTGYFIMGVELFRWEAESGARAYITDNISLNFELKRLLKTLQTPGPPPLNVVLDGTAIGIGIRTRF